MVTAIVVLGLIVLFLILWGVGIYNKLVRLRNTVQNSWAQIDVQLQRRYDLIPNLVECVKEYMGYERGTLEAVVQARSQAMSAREKVEKQGGPTKGSLGELLEAEVSLKGALGSIFALAENYPQLRASENMQQLQTELTATENRVAFSRQAYNDSAMFYNTAQQQFPAVFVAKLSGHQTVDLWKVEEEEAKKPVRVQF